MRQDLWTAEAGLGLAIGVAPSAQGQKAAHLNPMIELHAQKQAALRPVRAEPTAGRPQSRRRSGAAAARRRRRRRPRR